jgi:hypothetical protein
MSQTVGLSYLSGFVLFTISAKCLQWHPMDVIIHKEIFRLKQLALLVALTGICCGCLKVKFAEQPIGPETTKFENPYFSITYPKEWSVTSEPPIDFYNHQEGFKTIKTGEHEVFVFGDPAHPPYSVWLVFDREKQAEAKKRIPRIVQYYKGVLGQELYGKMNTEIRPVFFKNRSGMEIVVSAQGFKESKSNDPLMEKLRKVKKIAQEIPANNAERHEKAYHIVLLRLDDTVVTVNYVTSSIHSEQVAQRLADIVKSIKIKNGFDSPDIKLSLSPTN